MSVYSLVSTVFTVKNRDRHAENRRTGGSRLRGEREWEWEWGRDSGEEGLTLWTYTSNIHNSIVMAAIL